MYAIVNTGGKQYKVATDDVITVEKIEGNEGDKVTLPVIFLNDGKKIVTDPDKLAKAKVTAQIVEQFKGEKQLVFKFHKRKRYRRLKGHRQQLTKLKIVKVQATSRAKKAVKAEAEAVAIEKITEAVGKSTNPANYLLAQKYIQMMQNVAEGDRTKTVYLPYEATNLLGSIGGIKELFTSDKTNADAKGKKAE